MILFVNAEAGSQNGTISVGTEVVGTRKGNARVLNDRLEDDADLPVIQVQTAPLVLLKRR